MTEKTLPENWQEIRRGEFNRFIFRRGVLVYGVSLAIIFTLVKIAYSFFAHNFSFSFIDGRFIGETLFYILFWLFFGGILAWRQLLRKEKEFLSQK